MSVKAMCGNCKSVMFECSSEYLCSDYTCKNCGAINQFDMSKVPTKVVLPHCQGAGPTSHNHYQHISGGTVST
jgi:hypothetical protein